MFSVNWFMTEIGLGSLQAEEGQLRMRSPIEQHKIPKGKWEKK